MEQICLSGAQAC